MVVLFFRKTGNVVKSLKSASLELGLACFFCVSIDRLSIVIDIYRLLVSRFTSTTRCRLIDFDSLSMFFITVVRFFRKTGNVVKSLKSDRQKQERVRGWNGTNCGVVPVLVRRCRFVSMPIRVLVQFLLFFIVVSFFFWNDARRFSSLGLVRGDRYLLSIDKWTIMENDFHGNQELGWNST